MSKISHIFKKLFFNNFPIFKQVKEDKDAVVKSLIASGKIVTLEYSNKSIVQISFEDASIIPTNIDYDLSVYHYLITTELSNLAVMLAKPDYNSFDWEVLKVLGLDSFNNFVIIDPIKFTQAFIDSKLGKRFNNREPEPELYLRALQSQKTVIEKLKVKFE